MSPRELLHSLCYFLGYFPFTRSFPLIREVFKVFWDLCLPFDFILDFRNTLSLVAFNADCLSIDGSHVHNHVEVLRGLLVHTFAVAHAFLLSGKASRGTLKFMASGLMSV